MRHVPLRFRARCVYCNDEIDMRAPGVFSLQTGWMKNRSQGGGNALALREPIQPPQFACGECVGRLQRHLSPDQGQLFA